MGLQLIKPVTQSHVKINLFYLRNSFQFSNNIHINNLIRASRDLGKRVNIYPLYLWFANKVHISVA